MRTWPTRISPRSGRALLGPLLLAIGLVGCSGQIAPPTNTAPTGAPVSTPGAAATPRTASASPATAATDRPTAQPRVPAPGELQGRWRTVINDADKPVLTITDFKYTIERLGIGTGSIEISGDSIAFFGSNLCSGRGTYLWSIDSGTLTLAPVGSDPCANRADAIRNRPFTRLE